MMANDGHIAKDTLFEPVTHKGRAIDWGLTDGGRHQGAQFRLQTDTVYMAVPKM